MKTDDNKRLTIAQNRRFYASVKLLSRGFLHSEDKLTQVISMSPPTASLSWRDELVRPGGVVPLWTAREHADSRLTHCCELSPNSLRQPGRAMGRSTFIEVTHEPTHERNFTLCLRIMIWVLSICAPQLNLLRSGRWEVFL
jgi:hypothetical protein